MSLESHLCGKKKSVVVGIEHQQNQRFTSLHILPLCELHSIKYTTTAPPQEFLITRHKKNTTLCFLNG